MPNKNSFLKEWFSYRNIIFFTDDGYILPYILANEKIYQKYFFLKNKNGSNKDLP